MARILILDDEPDLVEACRMVLEANGHRVESVPANRKALPVIRRCRPDLLLVDWVMPGADGGQVLTALRDDEELKVMPVVVMSALIDGVRRARQAGADGFLSKPFGAVELLAAISPVLAQNGHARV